MSKYYYKSNLGKFIEDFVTQKNLLGFPYDSSSRILSIFDKFVLTLFPEEKTLSREIALTWATLKEGEHPNGLLRRITPIRQLGKFLIGIGEEAFVLPGHIPNRPIHYEPYIYSEEEVQSFFHSFENNNHKWVDSNRKLIVPAYFRLLYCCGLRSSEARLLHTIDLDLDSGRILIRESKGWESRTIFMDDDLRIFLCAYDSKIDALIPQRMAFFPNKDGGFLPKGIQDIWFHIFWDSLNIDTGASRPRVQDLRYANLPSFQTF